MLMAPAACMKTKSSYCWGFITTAFVKPECGYQLEEMLAARIKVTSSYQ